MDLIELHGIGLTTVPQLHAVLRGPPEVEPSFPSCDAAVQCRIPSYLAFCCCDASASSTAKGSDSADATKGGKTHYAEASYWDSRMQEQDGVFDWYATYAELEGIFGQFYPASRTPEVLMVGCGNSALSAEMHAAGYKKITNIDISGAAVTKMEERFKDLGMIWAEMDATAMNFDDNSFDIAVDKGTVDAMMSAGGGGGIVEALAAEVWRTLRPGGLFVLISHNRARRPLLEAGAARAAEKQQLSSEGRWLCLERRRCRLSAQATLINILRSKLKGKPIAQAFKDPEMLKEAAAETRKTLKEMALLEAFRMFKARKKAQAAKAAGVEVDEAEESNEDEEDEASGGAGSLFQPFCWVYILKKPASSGSAAKS